MKRTLGALLLVLAVSVAAAAPAHAARKPSGAEVKAIEKAITAKLVGDRSPTAGKEIVSGIRISTKRPRWASAVMEVPYAATAFVALRKKGRRWTVPQYGTDDVPCGIGMPAPVRRELFRGRGGARC